jgi:hypothetical protein
MTPGKMTPGKITLGGTGWALLVGLEQLGWTGWAGLVGPAGFWTVERKK